MIKLVDTSKEANCITHAGTFHSDEVFATILLENIFEEILLYRTNTLQDIDVTGKIVYDIGLGKYDHHGDNPKRRENGIPYSSLGLLWQEYGREYLKKITNHKVEEYFVAIDESFILEIDAIDNGFFPIQREDYYSHSIVEAISMFNPTWKEESSQDYFLNALEMGKSIYDRMIKRIMDKIDAKEYVENQLKKTETQYIIFDQYVPFMDILLTSKATVAKEILFAIFPSNRGGYNVEAIKEKRGESKNRLDFPKEWGGKEDKELKQMTGIETFRFCHRGLFLASCDTLEDAIKLANLAIKKNK